MAFATKYRIEGTSDMFGKVTVNIKKDGYVGSVINLDGVGRDWVVLKIGDNSSEMSSPILAGKLTLSFYVQTDFQTTEIGRSESYSFYIEVLDENSDQIWAGWAMPDEYTESYHNTPYIATVTASDGLEELKNIIYPLQEGKATLFTHIQNCLINTFVENNIFESVNIYSNGMNSTASDSPFKQAQVTYNSFRNINESPKSYEVLSALLNPFFARIYQYRGWRIENILEKRSSYVVREFDITGTYVGQSTFDPLVKFDTDYNDFRAFIQKSGQLSIRPALNNAEVYFNTVEPVKPTTTGGFQNADDWNSTTDLKEWTAVGSNITIEQTGSNFDNNEYAVKIPGRVTTLSETNYLESDSVPINSADYESINVDFAYFASYPDVIILGTKPILYFEVVFTETSTGDVYNWTGSSWELIPLGQVKKRLRIDFTQRNRWKTYSAVIDRVPSNGNIKFRFYKLVRTGTEGGTGITNLYLTAWKTNLITEQPTNAALLLEGATTNVFTTYKGPSFPHVISDGTVLNAAGVMDVSNTLTATWARRGVTESLNIRRLFLLQWLSFNSKPTEILSGTIYQKGEQITPMSVVKDKDAISSVRYVMQSYEVSLGTGIGVANYREIVTTDTNINVFQEYLDSLRLGDFFATTINYSPIINAPGLSPGANTGQIDFNFNLNGDIRGGLNQAEVTPSSIQNKARLDTTGLTGADIVFGAVKDTPTQENMTNLRLSDTYPILDTNFVPYTGAKSEVNLGERGLTSGYIKFDTTPTNTPTDQGTISWSVAKSTAQLVMNGTTQHIGQDFYIYVKNSSGADIPKGRNVRGAGTDGGSGHQLIEQFLANGTFPSESYLGITAEAIPNGGFGQVKRFGELDKINTSSFSPNALLYVSTTVAGGFQTTVPTAPNNIILVGKAINSKNNGDIFLMPHIGSNINNDEGVKIVSPATGDLLQRQSNGLFENRSLASIGLLTGSLNANYIPKATGATTLANSKIYEINDRVLINKTTDSGGTFQVNGSIQLSSNVQINNSFGLYFDEGNRIRINSAFGWDISSWTKTVFSTGNVEISAGNLSLRASSTGSAATHIPVFTADPASTMRTLVTRTPAQLFSDMGFKITSPLTGQILQLQSSGFWENKTKAQILGGTSSQFVKGDGSLDSTTYQAISEKGQANGYASLDSNGKVPLTQINDALLGNVNYQGLWNASTNTPTLANPPASSTKGYYYITNTAGTKFGISFEVGDWIISSGSSWSKVDNTDAVSSVFGRTGNVSAQEADYQSYYPRLSQSYNNPSWINQLAWSKITGTPTTLGGYGITDAVPSNRTLTINGTAFDLSSNRSWSVGTVTSVSGTGGYGGLTLSGTITSSGNITLGGTPTGTWPISITGNAATFASQGEGQFVYGDSGRRRGVRLITNWNQTTYQDVAFLSSETSTTNAPTTDFTYGLQYSFHRDGASYRTQMVTSLYSDLNIWVRNSRDADAWTSWKFLYHSGNLINPVTGTGNTNYLAKFTSNGSTIGNSAVFENGGNVGIGTTTFANSPRVAIASVGQNSLAIQTTDIVQGSAGTVLYIGTGATTGNSTYGQIVPLGNGGTSAANLVLQPTGSNGNVLIGTTSDNGARLQVSGDARFTSSVTAASFFESSDSRIKTLLEDNLDYQAIANVSAKYYEKNSKIELGYFAQDFESLLPSAVSKNEDGYLNLSYREVHTAKIAYLEKRINELEQQLKNIKSCLGTI